MPDVATGALVDGRYKVLSRLGAGGMADVFLAEDQQLGRKVALKLLHRRFAENPGFVERFRREAQSAAGLQHPNVVGIYDRGSYDGTYYIAMEYLPGRSLKQLIRQEAPLEQIRAIDIALQLLRAARFAHRRGVIHRDLKPHNVIVDESDHAKVTDFGIARAGASDMTETGSIMGTAQYLSPEQAQGHAVSATSDLYSVGVVMYEMLTGSVPFDADSAVTIALKHVSQPPRPVHELNPAIDAELEQIVLWALNKNPADRPANAEQMIAALEQVRERIVSGARGERTASFATVVPVPPLAEFSADGAAIAPDGALLAEEEPQGRRIWPWLLALLVLLLLAGGGVAAYLLTRPAKVLVPTVVRDSANTARTVLSNEGFKVSSFDVTNSAPNGTVIAQQPLAGAKVDKGSTVTLTVSTGPGNTTVPSVEGLPLIRAERKLRRAHLVVGRLVFQTSRTVPNEFVISTDPAAGSNPLVGTAVTLFVSTGKPTAPVPNVVGQDQSAATRTLTKAGFLLSTTNQVSSTTPGQVLSQSPAANSVVVVGSTITLTIAKAPPMVKVPNVTGMKTGDAKSTLHAAGFKVIKQTMTVTTKSQGGTVLSQTPTAGTKQKKGTTVTIVVGKYKAPQSTTTTTTPTTTTNPTTTPGG